MKKLPAVANIWEKTIWLMIPAKVQKTMQHSINYLGYYSSFSIVLKQLSSIFFHIKDPQTDTN